jgi:hypothetical protein
MIVFRRIVAIPLALVFILLFIVLLVVNRANATAGNPDFYIERLHEADIYNFIYDDIMPAALDELDADMDSSDWPVDVTLLKSKLPAMMEEALPPEWLEAQVAQAIDQIVPYVMGDTEDFTIAIPLEDRVAAVAAALKNSLHDEEFYNELYQQGISFALDEFAEMEEDLPEPLRLSRAEVDAALREVLPPDWIHAQVDAAVDAVVPYLTKEAGHFTIRLDVSGRMAALEDVVTDILTRPETYDYAVNDMAVSYLRDKINEIDIPAEIVINDSDIRGVIDEILPEDWYEARINDVVGQVFSYLRGDRDTIEISVYLGDLKPAAIEALTEMADQKLEDYYNALPQGTLEQTAEFLLNPPQDILPEYRPIGIWWWEVKLLAGIDIEEIVAAPINDLPDEYTFSDADIREALGSSGEDDMLAEARDFVRDGFTFTDADLYEEFDEQQQNIDDVREWVATDFLFTEQDLHEYMVDDEGGGIAEGEWQNMQDVRGIMGAARNWLWLAWIVPALLLAGVGFLGGRHWYSRIIWAASVLAVAALIVYIAFGPVFSAMARPEIDEAIAEAVAGNEGISVIAADKAASIAGDTVDSVIGGTGTLAIVLLVASLAVIAAAIFFHFRRRRSQAVPEEIPPDIMTPPTQPPSGDQPPID